jgi:N-acetylmuramic acid 6-phosphate etherase
VAALEAGGRLIYLGAGSPALMSLADALELPQTYGIPYDRIVLILADGETIATRLNGLREDDVEGARADIRAAGVGPNDCVIATSASGTTPYTLEGLRAARQAGARTIGIAGNAGAPLFAEAEVGVHLDTGPEVISGSTRMGAGTAQKAALNMLSTLIGVRLNHVYDGLMVNVKADNDKLRGRATRIVTTITGASAETAAFALEQSDGEVKPAILIAAGAKSLADAVTLLGATKGNVRQALAQLSATPPR